MRRAAVVLLCSGCLLAGKEGTGGGGDDDPPPPDGGNNFLCFDDSAFEVNDTLSSAFPTPFATEASTFNVSAAICPETDRDHYAIQLPFDASLQLVLGFDSGDPLDLQILDIEGIVVATGFSDGTFNTLRACIEGAPAGTYFALVFSGGAFGQNNYNLDFNTVPTCF